MSDAGPHRAAASRARASRARASLLSRLSTRSLVRWSRSATGDFGPRRSFRITRRAAGLSRQLVGSIVEPLVERSSMPQHVDVGFSVSELLSLRPRMRSQDRSASSWLHRLEGAAGLRIAKRVAGVVMAPRPAAVSVAWFGTLLRVSVRECEQSFRTCIPYVRSRDDLK